MYSKFRILLLVIVSTLYFSACSDSPGPVGYSLLNPSDMISLKEISSDSLSQQSNAVKTILKTGTSDNLLLGKINSATSSVLMKFQIYALPDSIKLQIAKDSIKVLSALIELYPKYTLGEKSSQFDFSVHKVNSGWTSASFDVDSLNGLNYNAENIAASPYNITDTLYSFDLSKDVVQDWFKVDSDTNLADDNGIYIKPSNGTNRVVGFQAYSSESTLANSIPKLKVIFEKPGKYKDTLTFISINDLHVVEGSLPAASNDYIIIQGGIAVNSTLKFDIPTISSSAIINNAALEFTLDTLASVLGTPHSEYLTVRLLTDSVGVAYDSLSSIVLTRSGDKISGNIVSYVQRWVIGEKNYGLLISHTNAINNLDLLKIISGKSADVTKRPKLKISYSFKR
ncbi:MAG: hypothetical protein NTX22_05235 [Ignavibacteriales bacterium]|nr:hypothetical protein [Ignavibacteriales bacterium]